MNIKKIKIILLALSSVVFCLSLGVSTAIASSKSKSPESFLTCVGAGVATVIAHSIPASIDVSACATPDTPPKNQCAPCISSLEFKAV